MLGLEVLVAGGDFRCPELAALAACLGLAAAPPAACLDRDAPAGWRGAAPAPPLAAASCWRCCRLRGAPASNRICCVLRASTPWKLPVRARLAGTPVLYPRWEDDTPVGSRCRVGESAAPAAAAPPLAGRLRCPASPPSGWLAGRLRLAPAARPGAAPWLLPAGACT